MKKIKSLAPFKTKAHSVISRIPGEIIRIPDEDYEEVKDKCELLDDTNRKKRAISKDLSGSEVEDNLDE